MIRLTLALLGALALAVSLGAGARASAQESTTLKLSTASGMSLKFSTSKLKAEHGTVTIVLKNVGLMPHNIALKGHGINVKGKVVPHGKTSKVTAKVKKGRYTFYCSVPGHEAAGMKGTLTVS
jgi:plastocyanin